MIKRNMIRCTQCGDIIESVYRHDFKYCKCGKVAVDGGKDYLKRSGDIENMIEMSEYENPCKEVDVDTRGIKK